MIIVNRCKTYFKKKAAFKSENTIHTKDRVLVLKTITIINFVSKEAHLYLNDVSCGK